MKKNFLSDGWSDLENEFELELEDSSSQEIQEGEFELADEELEDMNNEFESAEGEFEMEAGADYEDDHELEEPDHESRQWLGESNDYEYEDRIYAALNGEYESSYEMEQELDRVLYEMEMDYFWKSAKKLWNKHKNKILGAAKGFLPSGTLQTLAKVAGGDIRSLLKSDLLKKGLSMAANAVAPGVGGVIAGQLLDSEVAGANHVRNQAGQFVQTAKNAYQNMAKYIPQLKPGNIPQQISALSRQAFNNAVQRQNSYKGKKRQVIQTAPGSIVVVKPGRIIIYS
jgi:hypothetical protein